MHFYSEFLEIFLGVNIPVLMIILSINKDIRKI